MYRTSFICVLCSVKQFFAVVKKLDVNINAFSTKVDSALTRLEKKYDVTLALYQRFEKWVQMWRLNRSLSHSVLFAADFLTVLSLCFFFQNMQKYICFGFWWRVSFLQDNHIFIFCHCFLFRFHWLYVYFSCFKANHYVSLLSMVWCFFPQGARDNTELLDTVSFGQG